MDHIWKENVELWNVKYYCVSGLAKYSVCKSGMAFASQRLNFILVVFFLKGNHHLFLLGLFLFSH